MVRVRVNVRMRVINQSNKSSGNKSGVYAPIPDFYKDTILWARDSPVGMTRQRVDHLFPLGDSMPLRASCAGEKYYRPLGVDKVCLSYYKFAVFRERHVG